MIVKAIAVSLPNPDYYFTLHSHAYDSHAVWEPSDRERLQSILDTVDTLYRRPKEAAQLTDSMRSALLVPDLDRELALQRIVPYVVSADRKHRSRQLLHVQHDEVERIRLSGTDEEEGGFRHIVISRGAPFSPSLEVLRAAAQDIGRNAKLLDKDTGEAKTLEHYCPGDNFCDGDGQVYLMGSLRVRAGRRLVGAVRRLEASAATEGRLKVVMVPNDVQIKLTANKGGEVVKEICRAWS